MGLIAPKKEIQKLVAEMAKTKEKKKQIRRAEQRRQVGKGTYREYSETGLFGCWEGWPFQITDGSLVNYLDGSPPDLDGLLTYAAEGVDAYFESRRFRNYLRDYNGNNRVRTGLTLGLHAKENLTFNSWGNLHGVSFGHTGSGKFVSAIAPTLIGYSGATICIDPKGEACAVTANARKKLHSQTPCILDPFNMLADNFPSEGKRITYNPLDELKPEADYFYADATALADALLVSKNEKDPMWRNNAKDLLCGLIMLVCLHPEFKNERHLPKVRSLLSATLDEWPIIFNMMMSTGNEELKDCGRRMKGIPDKTFGGIVSQCNSDLQFLGDPVMKRILMSDPSGFFTFEKFLDSAPLDGFTPKDIETFRTKTPEKFFWDYDAWKNLAIDRLWSAGMSLYIILPPHYMDTHAGWLRMLMAAAINNASRKVRKGLPTLMLVDEAFQLRSFDLIPRAYSIMRGYKFRLWTFWQDLGQVKANFPTTWQSILGNSFQHFLGTRDLETAKYFSELSGVTEKMIKTGESWSTSSGYSSGGYSSGSSHTQSVGRVVEPRWRPEEILQWHKDWGLIFTGEGAMETFRKIYYYQQSWCTEHAAPNPYHR